MKYEGCLWLWRIIKLVFISLIAYGCIFDTALKGVVLVAALMLMSMGVCDLHYYLFFEDADDEDEPPPPEKT